MTSGSASGAAALHELGKINHAMAKVEISMPDLDAMRPLLLRAPPEAPRKDSRRYRSFTGYNIRLYEIVIL